MGYTERYEKLIGRVIGEHNNWCDTLAGKRVSEIPLRELNLLMDINPDYMSNIAGAGIDPEQFKVLPVELAMLHDKRK